MWQRDRSQGSKKAILVFNPKAYLIGFYIYIFNKCKYSVYTLKLIKLILIPNILPPSIFPRPGPLQAPAGHATSGRAGRCAAPWRPSLIRLRRPASYLAVGGRSRNVRGPLGGGGGGAGRFRAPSPQATPRGGWSPKGQPQRRLPVECPSPAAIPRRQRPRCPAPWNQPGTVPWILCSPFFMQILCKHNCGYPKARSPECAGHNRCEVYPNRWLKPLAAKKVKSEDKGMNQSFKVYVF